MLIIGDFNIDSYNKSNEKWFKCIGNEGFSQLIKSFTRITEDSTTTIDHIHTNEASNISDSGVLDSDVSDHKPIYFKRKINYRIKSNKRQKQIKFYDFKNSNIKSIDQKLYEEFNSFNFDLDINRLCNDMTEKFHQIIKNHMNVKTLKLKKRSSEEWITEDVIQNIKTKNKLKKQIEVNKQFDIIDTNLIQRYKNQRNFVNELVKRGKKTFIYRKLSECGSDSTKLWKVLNKLIPTKKSSKAKSDNNISSEEFNKFFVEEPKKLVQCLTCDLIEENTTNSPFPQFTIPLITETEVQLIINRMSNNKAMGSDSISMKMIKNFKFSLIPILTKLFNKSIETKTFPILWSIAKVIPLHKNGMKSDKNNYRPIALTPIFEKIFEKHIQNALSSHLMSNNILSERQFGFKKKHSTIDALISIQKECALSLNVGTKCALISIDLKKAFDLVDHKLLLRTLTSIGCKENSNEWFKSYLTNRCQFVLNNGTISGIKKLGISVGQGTILAPMLFTIFINGINELVLNGKLYLFADDMSLVVKAKTYSELESKINEDLDQINKWLTKHKLVPNIEKSNFILMGCPRNETTINVRLGEQCLSRVKETKILGLIFDNDMRFKSQLNTICGQISNRLKFVSRIRHFLPKNTLNFIFKSLILPLFDYGDIIWTFTYPAHLKCLVNIQKRAARIITFSKIDESSSQLFKSLNWMPIENRMKYHSMVYIYKCLKNLTSDHTSNLFQRITTENRRSARLNDDQKLIVPKIKNNFLKNTIFYSGVMLYNNLSYEIRNSSSLNCFKTKVLDLFNQF